MRMIKYFLIAIAALILAWQPVDAYATLANQTSKGQSIQTDREKVLRGLIDEFDSIMKTPYDKKPGNEVRVVYLAVKEKMNAGGLVWSILNDGKQEVFAAFTPERGGDKPSIQLNHALIDSAKRTPTLAMTVIMHEMKHAYDYFKIGDKYTAYMKNPLERFMYEMDSLFIEALFIQDFLAPRYKDLTDFERYVLTSLENDNLASVALVFMKEDMGLTYDLYKLGKRLDKGMDCKEYFEEFTRNGKAVFERPVPSEEFKKYQALIAIKTFTMFAAPLADGALARNERCKQNEYKAGIKALNEYVRRGNTILREQGDFIDDYASNVKKKYFVISDATKATH
jgi:hypothetical protein